MSANTTERRSKILDPGNRAEAGGVDSEADDAARPSGDRLVLWTRRPVCGRPTEVIHRLGSLRSAGAISDFEVETWSTAVSVEGDAPDDRAIEAFERFDAWAEKQGLSVRPPFEVKTVSPLVGDERTVLTLPILCLAVYDGTDLSGVYPCSDEETTYRIVDCLDAYDSEDDAGEE